MTVATTLMGLEEFFAYTNGLDTEDGELIEIPPESGLNQRITSFSFVYLLRHGVVPNRPRTKTEIAVMRVHCVGS